MTDFYFDRINEDNEIYLQDLIEYGTTSGSDYFNAALNRYLSESPDRRMIVIDNTTNPGFDKLLELLNTEEIGQVLIGRRTDRNTCVNYTLDCQLWVRNGIIDVRPHWTARKRLRTSEIIGTLLEPLKHEGLMGRTFLHEGDSKNRSDWHKAPVSNIPLLIAVCELAGYPYDDESTENLARSMSCKTFLHFPSQTNSVN